MNEITQREIGQGLKEVLESMEKRVHALKEAKHDTMLLERLLDKALELVSLLEPSPGDSPVPTDGQDEEEEEEETQKQFRVGLRAIQALLVEAEQLVSELYTRSDTVGLTNTLRRIAQRAEALADEAAIQCNGEYDPSWVDPADEELQRLRDEEAEAEYQRSLERWMAEEEALMAAQVEAGWLRPLSGFTYLASLDELLRAIREGHLQAEFEDGQWWTTGEDVHYWRRRRRQQ